MGHAEMNQITDIPAKIYLTSGQDHQTFQEIQRAEITDPYQTIGTYQTPTGQIDKEIEVKKDMITQWGKPLLTSKIYPNLTYKAYETILYPKVTYSFNTTTLTHQQLHNLQKSANKYYIPKIGFNAKFPGIVLTASYKYGGFKQSSFLLGQIHKQLQMFLGCIRDNNETGDLIETTVAYTQLEAGYVKPLLHA